MILLFEGAMPPERRGKRIKRITEPMNPAAAKGCPLSPLGSGRRTQWYFQRYVENSLQAGEMVSSIEMVQNRAVVERVMGFLTEEAGGTKFMKFLS